MAIETRISNEAYERLALAEPDRKWELHDGYLREKPPMSSDHNWVTVKLAYFLLSQLDRSVYQVRVNSGRIRHVSATYLVPDFFALPKTYAVPLLPLQDVLEVYDQPLPLVVEVWSRSTGDYDVEEKLAVYQRRGDLEIWRVHPYERMLTAWQRQSDGSYRQTVHREGIIRPIALPGVEIDQAALFDREIVAPQ